MKKIKSVSINVFSRKCNGCEKCLSVCNRKVFGLSYYDNKEYAVAEYPERCNNCGKCMDACINNAIEITKKINKGYGRY